jgi:hypothetical protein
MNGREPVQFFELMRWARRCGHPSPEGEPGRFENLVTGRRRDLTSREAHLLVILASYCNEACECFPSIKTLASDMGLRARKVEKYRDLDDALWGGSAKTEPTQVYYQSSAVSKAMRGLEELGLVWSKSGGKGRSATRELLFTPDPLSSASAEDNIPPGGGSSPDMSSAYTDVVLREGGGEVPEKAHVLTAITSTPEEPGMSSAVAEDKRPPHTRRTSNPGDEDPTTVRAAIVASLHQADATRRRAA